MRILMVAPFPPLRDGVGKYALQEVMALREEGHEVDVLAPVACAAHLVENFKTPAGGLLRLRRHARRYDRVILQYQPAHFHSRSWGISRVVSNLWMAIAFRTIRKLVVVCHEVEYPPSGRTRMRPEVHLARFAWRGARHVEFHTAHEVERMRSELGGLPRRVEMRDHGRYFRPLVDETKDEARRRLRLAADVPLLLCIGFIQPHKGFDRAVRAFRRVDGDAMLRIVGSVRAEIDEHRAHLDLLRDLAARDHRIEVIERAVSDEEFDRWIVASDVVVLPYREIWSSGVLERARTLGRPVIASNAGGMSEQIQPGDVMFSNDEELVAGLARFSGSDAVAAPMTPADALELVDEEMRRRGALLSSNPLDRAMFLLGTARGVHPVIVPSARPRIGRVLDLVKRVMRRGLGWLLTPLLGQVNRYNELSYEVLTLLIAAQREQDQSSGTGSSRPSGAMKETDTSFEPGSR